MSKLVILALFLAAVVALGDGRALMVEAETVDGVVEPTSSLETTPEGKSITRVKRYERTTGERVQTYVYTTGAGAALGSFAGPIGAGVGASAGFVTALVLDLTKA